MQRIPRVLYHYCSLSTFKNILDNKAVWLSDIRKSNDSLELKWIMGQCQYYMLKIWNNYIEELQKERGRGTVNLEYFEQFEKIYRLSRDYDAEDDTKNWVFCLSEKSDDLGQWRGYADDGQGIAIGFNSSLFRKINYIGDEIRTATVDFRFDKVCYSKKDVKDFFDKRVGLSAVNKNMSPDEVLEYMKRALAFSLMFAPLYKNECFKEEKEWRVFYSMFLGDLEKGEKPGIPAEKNKFSDLLKLEEYAFVQRGQNLVSHLELGFSKVKSVIHSITIGPKAKVTVLDIKLYLMSIGLLENIDDGSIKVRRSMVSYR